jgi:hypothetical protein
MLRIAYDGIRFHQQQLAAEVIRTRGLVCYLMLLGAKAWILLLTEGL